MNSEKFQPFVLNGYEFRRFIGSGSFSTAYEVYSYKYGTIYCAKSTEIRLDMLDQDGNLCDHELQVLLRLDHPGVIRFFDYFVYETYLIVILEFCPYGSLEDLIHMKKRLTLSEFLPIARTIGQALEYCHSQSVAHRDIKPQNIFVNTFGVPILGDFGLAQTYSKHERDSETCGTPNFAAPEIFNSSSYDPFKADVWSLGVTFYVMATGKLPWKEEVIAAHRQSVVILFPTGISSRLEKLIRSMLQLDPASRPNMQTVMIDPFFFLPPQLKSSVGNKILVSGTTYSAGKLLKRGRSSSVSSSSVLQTPLKRRLLPLSTRQKSLRAVMTSDIDETMSETNIAHEVNPNQTC